MLWKSRSRLRSEGCAGRRPACETRLLVGAFPCVRPGLVWRMGHVVDCQLPGAAAYSRSRPERVVRRCRWSAVVRRRDRTRAVLCSIDGNDTKQPFGFGRTHASNMPPFVLREATSGYFGDRQTRVASTIRAVPKAVRSADLREAARGPALRCTPPRSRSRRGRGAGASANAWRPG